MHPNYRRIRQKTIIIGSVSIFIGVIGAVIPLLPGTLFVFLGLSMLSLQSKAAFRALASLRARYPKLTNSVKKMETQVIDFFNLTTHKREYVTIPNKDGNPLSVLIEQTYLKVGIAILLHSASGVSESKIMETLAEEFKTRGFTIIRFNAYNGLGDSGGDFSLFTTTKYRDDFNAILAWARLQPWWQEKLIAVGHSVGGLIAGLYATEQPAQVSELVLIAPTISGESYKNAYIENNPEDFEQWKMQGFRTIQNPLSHEDCSFPYALVEDLQQYNLANNPQSLTMPVTILASTKDTVAPITHAHDLCKKIGKHATLITLQTIPHTPNSFEEMIELRKGLKQIHLQ